RPKISSTAGQYAQQKGERTQSKAGANFLARGRGFLESVQRLACEDDTRVDGIGRLSVRRYNRSLAIDRPASPPYLLKFFDQHERSSRISRALKTGIHGRCTREINRICRTAGAARSSPSSGSVFAWRTNFARPG